MKIKFYYNKMEEFDILKKKVGEHYQFFYLDGKKVCKKKILEYVSSLYFPPAYENIKINSDQNAKRYGVGTDSKNRKQYLYTKSWSDVALENKYKQIYKFTKYINRIKKKLYKNLELDFDDNLKIILISTALLLIIECNFRVGSEMGVEKYNSFGVSTLEKSHFFNIDNKYIIKFVGKKGVLNENIVQNKKLNQIINLILTKNKNYKIFHFTQENIKITSKDINNYLKSYGSFTTKNFRTYMANYIFLQNIKIILKKKKYDISKITHRKKIVKESVNATALKLHHTPSICKNSYIFTELWKPFIEVNPNFFDNLNNPSIFFLQFIENKSFKI
jgi:DNA topoisomerase-1